MQRFADAENLSPDVLFDIDWTQELGPGDAAVLASMKAKHLDGEHQ